MPAQDVKLNLLSSDARKSLEAEKVRLESKLTKVDPRDLPKRSDSVQPLTGKIVGTDDATVKRRLLRVRKQLDDESKAMDVGGRKRKSLEGEYKKLTEELMRDSLPKSRGNMTGNAPRSGDTQGEIIKNAIHIQKWSEANKEKIGRRNYLGKILYPSDPSKASIDSCRR